MNKLKYLFIFILAIFASGCMSIGSGYVLIVDGEKISDTEYMVYLDEQIKSFEEQGGSDIWEIDFDGVPASDVAKQNAVNSIVMVKAAVNHADQLGVSLSDEDIKSAHSRASELSSYENDPKLIDRIMEESAIQSKVYDKITGSYQINNDEFEAYLSNYYAQNKAQYTQYTVKEIFIQSTDTRYTKETIAEKYNSVKSEYDFDSFAKEVSPDNMPQPQILDESLYSEEVLKELAAAEEGSFVMAEDSAGWHIFNITAITQTPLEDIRAEVKEEYIDQKKQEIYNAQNDSWTSAMKVEKNNQAYDAIAINTDSPQETAEG